MQCIAFEIRIVVCAKEFLYQLVRSTEWSPQIFVFVKVVSMAVISRVGATGHYFNVQGNQLLYFFLCMNRSV